MPEPRIARARVPARAALAGNPSDGHGGAVLAVTVEALRVEATAVLCGRDLPASSPPASELLDATLRRFYADVLTGPVVAEVSFTSSIPRCVGLGGSSAIVIAVLRALCRLHGVELGPDELADLALSVEVDDLGISAGLQDRVAQCYGGLTYMEFGHPRRYERIDLGTLPPLVVGWLTEAGEASGAVHDDLGRRRRAGDAELAEGMRELAGAARAARDALLEGDRRGFAACVDASFDIRARLMPLDPRHVAMVHIARAEGAAVNYTGSGGAVICVCEGDAHRVAVTSALEHHGCATVPV